MTDKPMITLQVLLKSLADKIDQYYADQIDQSSRLKLVDLYEARAIEAIEKIEAVMQLAERYYPTEADTDLNLLQFQAKAEPLKELIEASEKALSLLWADNDALGYGTEEQGQAAMELTDAIRKAKGEAPNE